MAEEGHTDADNEDIYENTKKGFLPKLVETVFGIKDHTKAMLKVFDDSDSSLKHVLERLELSPLEKKKWLLLWIEIDDDRNNKISLQEFSSYFNFDADMWTKRIFELMNSSFTGVVSFTEFLKFCERYLIVDKSSTIEFAFRMISRRGSTYKREFRGILDKDDIKTYLAELYEPVSLIKRSNQATAIISYVNVDGDGGIEIEELALFTKKNKTLIAFSHMIQQHLRRCIFGIKYWVNKSRKLKLLSASTFDRLLYGSRINADSEKFTVELLDPVIDSKGNPIEIEDPETSKIAEKPPVEDDREDDEDDDDEEEENESDAGKKIEEKKDELVIDSRKSMLSWHKPFSCKSLPKRIFKADFAEIVLARAKKKKMKLEAIVRERNVAGVLAARVHEKLMKACSDLLHGRHGLRLAFARWLHCVDMDEGRSTASLSPRLSELEAIDDPSLSPGERERLIKERKHKAEIRKQRRARRGLGAVLDRMGDEAETKDIYAKILEATTDTPESDDALVGEYVQQYLRSVHSDTFDSERTRHIVRLRLNKLDSMTTVGLSLPRIA